MFIIADLVSLTNIYKDMGTRMNQFMSKMMSAVLLKILDSFAYN